MLDIKLLRKFPELEIERTKKFINFMTLKQFKQLSKRATRITIYNAWVHTKIHENYVHLQWRGVDSGRLFSGGVNEENLKDIKFAADFKDPSIRFASDNVIAVKLAFLNPTNQNIYYAAGYTPIQFWYDVPMRVK